MLNLVCHQIQEIFMFQKLVAEPGEKQKNKKNKKKTDKRQWASSWKEQYIQ